MTFIIQIGTFYTIFFSEIINRGLTVLSFTQLLLSITRCVGRMFPNQLCVRKLGMAMFKVNVIFIKTALREI